MRNFLDVARRLERRPAGEQPSIDVEAFRRVFSAIAELNQVYAKANIDTDNIEAVFAAFEMGRLFDRLGSLPSDRVRQLSDDMRTLIVDTLEAEIKLVVETGQQSGLSTRIVPPRSYRTLAQMIDRTPGRNSIITFNYDLALDFALHWALHPIDYCLMPQPIHGATPLMKLHGSINWVACETCGIAAYQLPEYFKKYSWRDVYGGHVTLNMREHLRDAFSHCNGKKEMTPLLVPPTWSKAEHHHRLANVWRHAARHLSEARNIIVIGYSLPETDHFFRYLYALGTSSPVRIENFWVIDSASGADAQALDARFRSMLGPTAEKRYRLLEGMTFEQILPTLQQTFFPKPT